MQFSINGFQISDARVSWFACWQQNVLRRVARLLTLKRLSVARLLRSERFTFSGSLPAWRTLQVLWLAFFTAERFTSPGSRTAACPETVREVIEFYAMDVLSSLRCHLLWHVASYREIVSGQKKVSLPTESCDLHSGDIRFRSLPDLVIYVTYFCSFIYHANVNDGIISWIMSASQSVPLRVALFCRRICCNMSCDQ
jgi:hypothetical protein